MAIYYRFPIFSVFFSVGHFADRLVALDYVVFSSPNVYGNFFFGKVTILLYWVCLQLFFLGGSASPIAIFTTRARFSASKSQMQRHRR